MPVRLSRGLGRMVLGAGGMVVVLGLAVAALIVPNEVQLPGTQPREAVAPEDPQACLTCHANFSSASEPGFAWQGSMMAQATRDPLFWATLAVAEQDFGGSGDFCIRRHSYSGWLGGRSAPADGSALTARDGAGVGVRCVSQDDESV